MLEGVNKMQNTAFDPRWIKTKLIAKFHVDMVKWWFFIFHSSLSWLTKTALICIKWKAKTNLNCLEKRSNKKIQRKNRFHLKTNDYLISWKETSPATNYTRKLHTESKLSCYLVMCSVSTGEHFHLN